MILTILLLGGLVGCNQPSIEEQHNLEENWRHDEF